MAWLCSGPGRFYALQIITPVVERSVTIACMTTQELVVKDFALEPDDNTLRQVGVLNGWPLVLCGSHAVPVNDISSAAQLANKCWQQEA